MRNGAADETLAVTVIGGYEAAPISASDRVQAVAEQVQPSPAIDTAVRAAGRISATVTVPLVGPAPGPVVTVRV
jgi:hypothetical protein